MKITLILLLIFCLFTGRSVQAQKEFAPIGAEWYYAGDNYDYMFFWQHYTVQEKWVDHMKSVKDTTFLGMPCRKLEVTRQKRDGKNPQLVYNWGGVKSVYLYAQEDTVFVYNEARSRFTPLYIFTAQSGDTICIPKFDTYRSPGEDTMFCYVVDSIKIVDYGSSPLRTWFTRGLTQELPTGPYSWNWGYAPPDGFAWISKGCYAEKLGGIGTKVSGFFPTATNHNEDAGVNASFPSGFFNCYRDQVIDITMTERPCDEIAFPRSDIRDLPALSTGISIYPNPVQGYFKIKAGELLSASNCQFQLLDLTGRVLLKGTLSGNPEVSYDISFLPDGVYYLKLQQDVAMFFKKIVVQR